MTTMYKRYRLYLGNDAMNSRINSSYVSTLGKYGLVSGAQTTEQAAGNNLSPKEYSRIPDAEGNE